MRKELLKKRGELHKAISEMDKIDIPNDKAKGIKFNQLRKQKIEEYKFINNLLKVSK